MLLHIPVVILSVSPRLCFLMSAAGSSSAQLSRSSHCRAAELFAPVNFCCLATCCPAVSQNLQMFADVRGGLQRGQVLQPVALKACAAFQGSRQGSMVRNQQLHGIFCNTFQSLTPVPCIAAVFQSTATMWHWHVMLQFCHSQSGLSSSLRTMSIQYLAQAQ